MKRIPTILAAGMAVLAVGSCAKSEVISSREKSASNEIEFSATSRNSTKAAEISASTLSSFSVTAFKGENTYFENVVFTKANSSQFKSDEKYFWPNNEELNFFAYAPVAADPASQIEVINEKSFKLTPDATVDSKTQPDLIFANTASAKPGNGNSIALNFFHAASRIRSISAANTSASLRFEIYGEKFCGIDGDGTFTYTGLNGDGYLKAEDWDRTGCSKADYEKTNSTAISVDPLATNKFLFSQAGSNSLILVPQTTAKAAAYGTDGKLDGAYIAIKLIAKNAADNTIVLDNGAGEPVWCCWPVDIDWAPGKSYSYSIDVSTGGYREEGTPGDEPENVIDGSSEIQFASVSVNAWDEAEKTVLDKYNGNGHVDLGLPSGKEWAEKNLGAEKVTDFGLYFAWAETVGEPYSTLRVFNASTYAWWDAVTGSFTKYNATDGKTVLDLCDDAARKALGGGWRTPDQADYQELKNNTYSTAVTGYNGSYTNGIVFYKAKDEADKGKTSNPVATYTLEDTHIFLPYAGYILGDTMWHDYDQSTYWTSSADVNVRITGSSFMFSTFTSATPRVFGLPIRAIVD